MLTEHGVLPAEALPPDREMLRFRNRVGDLDGDDDRIFAMIAGRDLEEVGEVVNRFETAARRRRGDWSWTRTARRSSGSAFTPRLQRYSSDTGLGTGQGLPASRDGPASLCPPTASGRSEQTDAGGAFGRPAASSRAVRLRPSGERGFEAVEAADGQRVAVMLASQGDHGAFEDLVAPRRARLLLLLAAVLGDWQDAEDALQDALWRAYRDLHQLRQAEAFDAWLRGLAINVARDRLRAAVARRRREGAPGGDLLDLEGLEAVGQDVPVGAAADRDGVSQLLAGIAALPDLQRRAASLAWVAGVPPGEVAATLGMTKGGVHACLYRARRRLGASLRPDGAWRKDVVAVAEDDVLLSGFPDESEPAAKQSDLRVRTVAAHDPAAHVHIEWSCGEPLDGRSSAPAPAEALPLDGLADAGGLDLEPFGDRLLRFSYGGRPYWLPRVIRPHVVTYNADLLERVGLPVPPGDWTWDDFFGYCRRCSAAGVSPHSPWTPNGMDTGIVAEQLGATGANLEPVREAADFVQRWRGSGLAHPEPRDRNALLSFFEGQTPFLFIQQGDTVPARFAAYGCRPFRWGLAPFPRFRRSDRSVPYWFYRAVAVTAAAPDPVAAFRVAAAMFTDGPPPAVDALPAYRTREGMRVWSAQPLPLGKECLLALDAETGPLWTPPWLCLLPGGGDALWSLAFSEVSIDAGIAALRAAVAARAPGTPLPLRD